MLTRWDCTNAQPYLNDDDLILIIGCFDVKCHLQNKNFSYSKYCFLKNKNHNYILFSELHSENIFHFFRCPKYNHHFLEHICVEKSYIKKWDNLLCKPVESRVSADIINGDTQHTLLTIDLFSIKSFIIRWLWIFWSARRQWTIFYLS